MTLNALPATTGCGCGGCGSGGAVTADVAATAFVRPRFFAGQLLTEDDLSLLTTYTTAKNRLHNRYLFGAGVVCGLWVACDPCGGGTVTVQPGYALDCCGNDLVLACPETLDINAMIRDLRAAQLGKDCVDPCADQATQPAGKQPAAKKPATGTRHYCLYARYGEQETDMVAPYATEEPCGQTACEPTRIQEGTSFVLKCPEDTPPADDLWRRLCKCLPSKDILRQADRLKAYAAPMAAAAAAAADPPTFGQEDAGELESLQAELARSRKSLAGDQIQPVAETLRKLAAVVAKYDLAKDPPKLDNIPAARSELAETAAALSAHIDQAWSDPLDLAAMHALLRQAAELADPAAAPSEMRLAMLAQGRPLDNTVLATVKSDADKLLEWLLGRLDSDPSLADCELRALAHALSLGTTTTEEASAARSLGHAGSELIELFTRWLADCSCAALNPPCAPCEDTDVLLACLEVRDCTVVRICNADRDYVISGSALRYWLPVGFLRQHLESFCCCQDKIRRSSAGKVPGTLAFQETGFGTAEPVAGLLQQLCHKKPADLLREAFQRARAELTAPTAPQPSPAEPQPSPAEPQLSPAAPAADRTEADATAQQVAALAERVTELTNQLDDAEARLATLASQPAAGQRSSKPPADADQSPPDTEKPPTEAAQSPPDTEKPPTAAQSPPDTEKPPTDPGPATASQPSAGPRPSRRSPAARSRTGPRRPAAGRRSSKPPADADQSPPDTEKPPTDPGPATAGPASPEVSDGT